MRRNKKKKAILVHLIKINESQSNADRMVIATILLNIIFKFVPELVGHAIIFIISDDQKHKFSIPMVLRLDPLILNVIQYVYIISYLTNIFFYYCFNKQFRKAFKAYFNHIKTDRMHLNESEEWKKKTF